MSKFKSGRGGLYYKVDERGVVHLYDCNPDIIGAEAEYITAIHIDYVPSLIATLRMSTDAKAND